MKKKPTGSPLMTFLRVPLLTPNSKKIYLRLGLLLCSNSALKLLRLSNLKHDCIFRYANNKETLAVILH